MVSRSTSSGSRRSNRTRVASDDQIGFDFVAPDGPPGSVRPEHADREERFFTNARTPASQVKSRIAIKTFLGWSGVMLSTRPVSLRYLDLYCGKGLYDDGTPSTPVELFEKIAAHSQLPSLLRMVFNDRKKKYVFNLRDRLIAHPGFAHMTHKPQFSFGPVSKELIAGLRAGVTPTPTFAFLDPFGYKGMSQDVIRMVLQDFGCDVLFFFSYHAIKRVLSNPNSVLRGHVEALLGVGRVAELRERFRSGADERENEAATLRALGDSMNEINGLSVLPFAFRRRTGAASHHLAFVSKNIRGYQVAKEAMKLESSWSYDGAIPGLEFIAPGYEHRLRLDQGGPSIGKLMHLLVSSNRGKLVTRQQAYDSVTLGTPYVETNVREALVGLVRDHGARIFVGDSERQQVRGSQLPTGSSILMPRTFRGI